MKKIIIFACPPVPKFFISASTCRETHTMSTFTNSFWRPPLREREGLPLQQGASAQLIHQVELAHKTAHTMDSRYHIVVVIAWVSLGLTNVIFQVCQATVHRFAIPIGVLKPFAICENVQIQTKFRPNSVERPSKTISFSMKS